MKQSSSIVSQCLMAVLAASSVHCSRQEIPQQNIRKHSPQSETDVGYVVSGIKADELANLVQMNPDATVRTVNLQHQIYEIFNSSENEIRSFSDSAEIQKNSFTRFHQQDVFESKRLFAELAEAKGSDIDLKKCKHTADSPDILVEAKIIEQKSGVIQKGETISLSLAQTKPIKGSHLKFAWGVTPPLGSLQEQELINGSELNYKPDTMGSYSLLALAQDDENNCGFQMGAFVVTGNEKYLGNWAQRNLKFDKVFPLKPFTQIEFMKSIEAWKISKGDGQIIAVIDGGVNYNHVALANNILVNENEIPDNGKDDDGNGFVDDYVGYDFANSDAYPYDDNGHGSHVSGLAASSFFGMAPNAKILAVKALSPLGGDDASIIGAIYYAVDRGARILNLSLGNYSNLNKALSKAIDYANKHGSILLVAAGNGHPTLKVPTDNDKMPFYPASMPQENVIAVAASSPGHSLASYSNFGAKSVEVVAPGGDGPDDLLMSSFSENAAGMFLVGESGTSMACPIVAGVVAQMLALKPKLTVTEIREILLKSGEKDPGLVGKVISERQLNALDALNNTK